MQWDYILLWWVQPFLLTREKKMWENFFLHLHEHFFILLGKCFYTRKKIFLYSQENFLYSQENFFIVARKFFYSCEENFFIVARNFSIVSRKYFIVQRNFFFIKVSQSVDYKTSWEKSVPKTQWLYIFPSAYWYNVCVFIPVGLFIIKRLLKIRIHRNDVWVFFLFVF